jgi:nitrate/TMAO reductase-like tetraheme cytochrome c subunit
MADSSRPGFITRAWRALTSPSARWSVLALVVPGIVSGAGGVILTDVMVKRRDSRVLRRSLHSMKAFTLPEYKESSHFSNKAGVQATCADCHIPHSYPSKLFYKAQAGIRDIIQETRGVIATQAKYEKERWRMANHVWEEMKANDSANCRHCHKWDSMAISKQKPMAQKLHEQARKSGGKMTCIDCHQASRTRARGAGTTAERKSENAAAKDDKAAASSLIHAARGGVAARRRSL